MPQQHSIPSLITIPAPDHADWNMSGPSCVRRKFSKDLYANVFGGGLFCGEMNGVRCFCCGSETVTGCVFDWTAFNESSDEHQDEELAVMYNVLHSIWNKRNGLKKLTLRQSPRDILEPDIGTLTELTDLVLDQSRYNQNLHIIGQLSNLKRLEINCCHMLATLPPEVYQLEHLRTLILSCNRHLQFAPSIEEAGRLQKLEVLEVCGNSIPPTLPLVFCSLMSLKRLTIVHGLFREVPPEIGRLRNLEVLEFIHCTNLVTLPAEVWELRTLKILAMSGTARHISPSIANLVNLESLSIDYPELESIPGDATRTNLTKLAKLSIDLYSYPIAGPDIFPPTLKELELLANDPEPVRNLLLNAPCLKDFCPCLESLDIAGCAGLEKEDFVRLLDSLPSTLRSFVMLDYGNWPGYIGWEALVDGELPSGITNFPCIDACDVPEVANAHVRHLLEKYERLGNIFTSDYTAVLRRSGELPLPEYEMYLLMLNRCGRELLRSQDDSDPLPRSMWPQVLSRVYDRVHSVLLHRKSMEEDCTAFAASVVFELLHCPVFGRKTVAKPESPTPGEPSTKVARYR